MSLDLGRVAYDAYRLRRGGVAYDGTAIPEWLALRPEIREAWIDAAAAVVGARSAPPAGAIDLDAARKAAREAQELFADGAQYADRPQSERVAFLAALVLAMAEELERLRSDAPAPQERAILDALKVDLALVANPSTTFEDAVKNGQRDSHWFRLAIDYLSRPR